MQFVKIGFVGCISSGKSTTLNCIFGAKLTPMGIDKTTMLPTEYINHTSFKDTSSQDVENIFHKASKNNNSLKTHVAELDLVSQVEKVNLKSFCLEQTYLKPNPLISVIDFPGLNDSLFDKGVIDFSLEKLTQCHMIVLVVDVKSALNSKDEIQLLENVRKIRDKQRKLGFTSDVIVAINKWDQPNDELKSLKISIKSTAKKYIPDSHFSLISSLNKLNLLYTSIPICFTEQKDEMWEAFVYKINSLIRAHIPYYYLYNMKVHAKNTTKLVFYTNEDYDFITNIHKSLAIAEKSLDCKYSSEDLEFVLAVYENDGKTAAKVILTGSFLIFLFFLLIILIVENI